MSRPSFRPRPIDLTKPLPIIKSSKDLRNEDDVVVNRALPAIATGVDPAEEEERHLKQALLASVYGDTTKSAVDIPIPVTRPVQPPKMPMRDGPFKRPTAAYIVFDRSDDDLEHASIDYDADFEDEAFIKKFNQDHPIPDKSKLTPLTIVLLERVLDALEKAQGRSGNEDSNLVPYSSVRAAISDAMPTFSDLCRRQVYAHWSARRDRHPVPFLRFYQKQPDPSDHNPAVAFRPRDKDAATAGRRMNTFENFRRATTLRAELDTLRKILRTVITRDRLKLELLSVSALQSRLDMLIQGGTRIENASRRSLHTSREAVVLVGEPPLQSALPARDLSLPSTVTVTELPGDAFGGDKLVKKGSRRGGARTAADKRASSTDGLGATNRAGARAGLGAPLGVDNYGFDEHGNRFLKHMRYFAGGFMNYGVCPYDHRVFSAASERNTVRDLPREPQPMQLPNPHLKFAALPEPVVQREAAARTALRRPSGGKTGLCGTRDPAAAAEIARLSAAAAHSFQPQRAGVPKRRRPVRVRGRVGRGGRIMFDRVVYERQRGVKAASYPSSVEMGGVYAAGIPLEAARRVLRSATRGNLGQVALLQPRAVGEDDAKDGEGLFARLVTPLKPVTHLSKGVVTANGEIDYWPHRRTRSSGKYGLRVRDAAGICKKRTAEERVIAAKSGVQLAKWGQSLRALPAFAPIGDPLVVEVEPEVSAMT